MIGEWRVSIVEVKEITKEPTMKSHIAFVWSCILFTSLANSLARADDAPKLPDQYAEAVLDVEGMT